MHICLKGNGNVHKMCLRKRGRESLTIFFHILTISRLSISLKQKSGGIQNMVSIVSEVTLIVLNFNDLLDIFDTNIS